MSTHVQTDGKDSRISSDTEPWDTGFGSVRPFRALRQPVQMTGCRRAFFIVRKEVACYEFTKTKQCGRTLLLDEARGTGGTAAVL